MIKQIIILIGFLGMMDALFTKWGVWHKIEEITMDQKYRFIYDLGSCRLCLMFHISIILYFILWASGLFLCFNFEVIVASNGIIHLIKR